MQLWDLFNYIQGGLPSVQLLNSFWLLSHFHFRAILEMISLSLYEDKLVSSSHECSLHGQWEPSMYSEFHRNIPEGRNSKLLLAGRQHSQVGPYLAAASLFKKYLNWAPDNRLSGEISHSQHCLLFNPLPSSDARIKHSPLFAKAELQTCSLLQVSSGWPAGSEGLDPPVLVHAGNPKDRETTRSL